jgi:hypothetical protein
MGSTAVLVEGTRLFIDEAENPKSKKKVCVSSKPFKARNTGCGETHESDRKLGEGKMCLDFRA